MLCAQCKHITFKPHKADNNTTNNNRNTRRRSPAPVVVHLLHASRASFSQALAGGCPLCLLISSQLGQTELLAAGDVDDGGGGDICTELDAFMVLTRRWPPSEDPKKLAKTSDVRVHSRLGSASLAVIETLAGLPNHFVPNSQGYFADMTRPYSRIPGSRYN